MDICYDENIEKAKKEKIFWIMAYVISAIFFIGMILFILLYFAHVAWFYIIPYLVGIIVLPIFCFRKKEIRGKNILKGMLIYQLSLPLRILFFCVVSLLMGMFKY